MQAELIQSASIPKAIKQKHVLVLFPKAKKLPGELPGREALEANLARRAAKPDSLADGPVAAPLANGALVAWAMLDFGKPVFDRQSAVRKALMLLRAENPTEIAVVVLGADGERQVAARLAAFCAWVNGAPLPVRKKKDDSKPLARVHLFGWSEPGGFAGERACAEGNTLARELTVLPPNELTPLLYRGRVRKLAKAEGWKLHEYDLATLKKMGAGAFLAVARGSDDGEAAIVHLSRRVKGAKARVALVGKGVCFDTGGHNLKPARYMHGMHEDMNGSAVALGILLAATRANVPVDIDCWLALVQNHISPKAYKQNEVVTALNGTTIEIMHTDAEGRMILSDTLSLAAGGKPDVMVDFATLTGTMHVALGNRYSGIFSNRDELIERAIAAGRATGERVCAFPLDADYDPALDSKIADVKQCTLDSNADHVLAARFLGRFVEDLPWVHMDLSASSNEGGLGAVASDVTGFGVAWGVEFLRRTAGG